MTSDCMQRPPGLRGVALESVAVSSKRKVCGGDFKTLRAAGLEV